jgi:O-antigen/teichoic acid export membrane protein
VEEQFASEPMPAPRVLRNATLLVVAQAVGAPVSVLVNAIAARELGATGFGLYYQALTFASFAFLFVEWGQPGALTARIATDRAAAGELLGSGLSFRLCTAALACVAVPLLCLLAGYDRAFVAILALALLGGVFSTVAGACLDVLRGFERTDFAAASYIGWQLLSAAAVVPTLLSGGGLRGMLLAQVACAAIGAAFVLSMLPRLQVPKLSVRWATAGKLIRAGQPFLVFGLVLMLQPMVDAAMLSAFGAPEAMGWYAAARKLVGVLTYPASALLAALYPTLCRLRVESMDAFRSTAADSFQAVAMVVVPLALGCFLFPDLGVAIFGQRYYGPTTNDLRLLAPYIFLVYFSMPIGSCLTAYGRQAGWTMVQLVCVLISTAFDPLMIRWFQLHTGNGGLGVCLTTVISEVLMVIGGLWLLPKGVVGKVPRAKVVAVGLSGVGMAVVALALGSLDVILRALLAVLAYLVCLRLAGGVSFVQFRSLVATIRGR